MNEFNDFVAQMIWAYVVYKLGIAWIESRKNKSPKPSQKEKTDNEKKNELDEFFDDLSNLYDETKK